MPIRTGTYNSIGWPEYLEFPVDEEGNQLYSDVDILEKISGMHPKAIEQLGFVANDTFCTEPTGEVCYSPFTKVYYPGAVGGMRLEELTLADQLKVSGYTSGVIGKWHLGVGNEPGDYQKYLPLQRGFDRFWGMPYSNDMGCPPGIGWECEPLAGPSYAWTPVPLYSDNYIVEQPTDFSTYTPRQTQESIKFIRNATNEHKPFFLLHTWAMPHVPLFTANEFVNSSSRGTYGDAIQELDASIGDILNVVEELGLDNNTVVFFFSDNGPFPRMGINGGSAGLLRGGKGTTWEGGIRSPCVVKWPGKIAPKSVSNGITAAWDFFSTIVSMAGAGDLPTDRGYDGIDLTPVLTGTAESVRECQNLYSQKYLMATRCGSYKVHWYTREALTAPVAQNPPLIYNVNVDPSEDYPIVVDSEEYLQALAKAESYRDEYLSTLDSAPGNFQTTNVIYQPCCCPATNCTCTAGYTCEE